MKIHFRIAFLLLCCGIKMVGQETDSITARFLKQLAFFPQEKIFVHTDRTSYMSGDTIWLRAHLLDAATHTPAPVSRYVYVELANEADSVIGRVKIRANDSIYAGHIPLHSRTPQGYYTLRAYTTFMRNLPEDYLFKSTITLSNSYSEEAPQTSKRGKRGDKENERKEKSAPEEKPAAFDLAFFPEGGYLPGGVQWRVAFKVIGADGWSKNISGEVVEKVTQEVVAPLPNQYLGMGYITFTPQVGKEYVANCTDEEGNFLKFDLPSSIEGAQVLAANWRKELLTLSLSQPVDRPLRLVMQSRGVVFYSALWTPDQKILGFESSLIPAGVIQLLLLDENDRPISERLVFGKNLTEAKTDLTTDRAEYAPHQRVSSEVSVTDANDVPLKGDFSVAVTDDATVNTDNAASILTYMLLTSDLRGTIEFPEAYFDPEKKLMDRKLDLLMMTQGWKRYDVSKLLEGRYEHPAILPERSQEITGTVVGNLTLNTKANCQLSLLSIDHPFVDETTTDAEGRFCFTRFEMPDSTSFVIKALNRKGQNTVLLNIDKEIFYPFQPSRSVSDLFKRKEVAQAYAFDTITPGIRMVQLDEVVVSAKAPEKKGKSIYHSMMGRVFTSEDFMRPIPNNLADLLMRLPGIYTNGGSITMRGQSPLFLLDDVEIEFDAIKDISADDIDEIELIKDASAAIFGSKGGGGAILITTKTGIIHKGVAKPNIGWTRPLGYQLPVEFYSPKYEPDKLVAASASDARKTLYWNPFVSVPDSGKAQFEFYTADRSSAYTVIVQGVTSDGRIIYMKKKINTPR